MKLIVEKNNQEKRLDKWLVLKQGSLSRSQIKDLIESFEAGGIKVVVDESVISESTTQSLFPAFHYILS